MDAIYLPRLYASSILPAWRRAWSRKAEPAAKPATAATYVPLPAVLARGSSQPIQQQRPALPQVVPGEAAHVRPPAYRLAPQADAPLAEARLRVRQDPCDARRVRVAGSMAEVCAALERLVRWQESEPH